MRWPWAHSTTVMQGGRASGASADRSSPKPSRALKGRNLSGLALQRQASSVPRRRQKGQALVWLKPLVEVSIGLNYGDGFPDELAMVLGEPLLHKVESCRRCCRFTDEAHIASLPAIG